MYVTCTRCRLNTTNCRGETACIIASMNGHVEALKLLLEVGCDIHIVDCQLMTAFLHACRCGFIDIMQLLKDHGADLSAPDGDGISPPMIAAKNGNIAALGWFEAEARVRIKDGDYFKVLALSALSSPK